ncbi:SH3 domain-containing protein [Mucilaginibacter roseus]|uniref:SH3 domain-containing protein n=1 Tax=Mucilaginibacter roseus TaxID=1528868 RepID=A0ABS8U4K7_9SPHI|nr:SH3 domain-containing protein [Mucilaginibacter roseus]MCD8742026.1 SH3 domain-containing protein [Mucilaginibacter roseus]
MKKAFLLLSLLLNTIVCLGQSFAIINDKDGFVNIRKQPSLEAKIIARINDDEIFWIEELKQDWYGVYFSKGDESDVTAKRGYIHKSRVKLISNLAKLGIRSVKPNARIIGNDSIAVSVHSSKFNMKKHKAEYINDALVTIDNKHFWGTDGNAPKRHILSLEVFINHLNIAIPKSAYNDLYEPTLRSLNCYVPNKSTLYIIMENGDGAGGYFVIWIIKNNKYQRRSIQVV